MYRKLFFVFAVSLVAGSVAIADDPNLVGWWKLDETSGMTAADSSGKGNNGTLSGYLGGDEWTTGFDGGALRFNWDGYINCGTAASLNITKDFTVCAWVKPGPGSESSYMGIGGRLVSAPTYQGFSLVRHSSGVFRLWTANKDTAAVVGASSTAMYTASEWHHVAGVRTGSTCSLYVDGVKAGSADVPVMAPSSNFVHIAMQYANSPTDRLWIGLIDDFRLYNRGLTDAEIAGLGTSTKARNPSPVDGAVDITMPLFQWKAASNAQLQNVYFGTNPEPGQAEFKTAVPPAASIYVQPGLEPGAKYYWRVDTIDATGTVHTGDVWSFTVMPLKAHFPNPSDGAQWRSTNLKASWTAGQGAISHILYAGTDKAPVAAGEPGAMLAKLDSTSFDATGLLQPGTTYYWRIDEIDATGAVHPGDVWTFSTVDPNGGAVAEYWAKMFKSEPAFVGAPDVVKIVPEINFDWGDGPTQGVNSPDPCIPTNLFSCRWTAELNVPVTGKYILYEASDDGARLFLNGKQVASGWVDRGTTEDRTLKLDLVAGEKYQIVMEMYENGGGATAFLRWSGPGFGKEIIPQGALQPPVMAFSPSPANGVADLTDTTTLSWMAGLGAVQHNLYFGTDEALVTAGDAGVAKGTLTAASFDPGPLTWGAKYFWKVDAVAADGTVTPGAVWSFTVIDYQVIEDFEAYYVAPRGWWKFDGNAKDSSGNGFDGTENNGPTYVAGVDGQAIHMDGVDDFVVVGSVGISGTMPRTIAGWVKADTTNIVDWTNIFGFTSKPDGACDLSFDIDKIGGENKYCIHTYCFERTMMEIDLEWHHVAGTYDGTTVRWYGDGALYGAEDRVLATQDNVQMGKRGHAAGGNWPGSIDDVRIYKAALSDENTANLAGLLPPTGLLSDAWKAAGTVTADAADVAHQSAISMKLDYDTSAAPNMGSASLSFEAPVDLTRGGAQVISMWVLGDAANAPETLSLVLEDSAGAIAVAGHPNPAATQMGVWWKVNIPLASFTGVDLKAIIKLSIGIGTGKAGGKGTIYVDDITVANPTAVISDVVRENGRSGDRAPIGPFEGNTPPPIITGVADGDYVFSDREFTWLNTPFELMGSEYLRTFNNDKNSNEKDVSYTVTLSRPTIVWITVDTRIPGDWNADGAVTSRQDAADLITAPFADPGTFTSTGLNITIREKADGTADTRMEVFAAELAAGTYVFGPIWSNKDFYTIGAIK